MKICNKCGKENADDASFCNFCGNNICIFNNCQKDFVTKSKKKVLKITLIVLFVLLVLSISSVVCLFIWANNDLSVQIDLAPDASYNCFEVTDDFSVDDMKKIYNKFNEFYEKGNYEKCAEIINAVTVPNNLSYIICDEYIQNESSVNMYVSDTSFLIKLINIGNDKINYTDEKSEAIYKIIFENNKSNYKSACYKKIFITNQEDLYNALPDQIKDRITLSTYDELLALQYRDETVQNNALAEAKKQFELTQKKYLKDPSSLKYNDDLCQYSVNSEYSNCTVYLVYSATNSFGGRVNDTYKYKYSIPKNYREWDFDVE